MFIDNTLTVFVDVNTMFTYIILPLCSIPKAREMVGQVEVVGEMEVMGSRWSRSLRAESVARGRTVASPRRPCA